METIFARHVDRRNVSTSPVVLPGRVTSFRPPASPRDTAEQWIKHFDHAMESRNARAVAALFCKDGMSHRVYGMTG